MILTNSRKGVKIRLNATHPDDEDDEDDLTLVRDIDDAALAAAEEMMIMMKFIRTSPPVPRNHIGFKPRTPPTFRDGRRSRYKGRAKILTPSNEPLQLTKFHQTL